MIRFALPLLIAIALVACDQSGAKLDALNAEANDLVARLRTATETRWISVACGRLAEIERETYELAVRTRQAHVGRATGCPQNGESK